MDGMLVTRGATDPSIIIYKETQNVEVRDTINFEFEARPEKIKLPPGVYDIDCYGGDGSFRYLPLYSGRGGYAHARFTNLSTKTLYARVAGNGFHGSIYQLENYDILDGMVLNVGRMETSVHRVALVPRMSDYMKIHCIIVYSLPVELVVET
jgi:hypothetical protein